MKYPATVEGMRRAKAEGFPMSSEMFKLLLSLAEKGYVKVEMTREFESEERKFAFAIITPNRTLPIDAIEYLADHNVWSVGPSSWQWDVDDPPNRNRSHSYRDMEAIEKWAELLSPDLLQYMQVMSIFDAGARVSLTARSSGRRLARVGKFDRSIRTYKWILFLYPYTDASNKLAEQASEYHPVYDDGGQEISTPPFLQADLSWSAMDKYDGYYVSYIDGDIRVPGLDDLPLS